MVSKYNQYYSNITYLFIFRDKIDRSKTRGRQDLFIVYNSLFWFAELGTSSLKQIKVGRCGGDSPGLPQTPPEQAAIGR